MSAAEADLVPPPNRPAAYDRLSLAALRQVYLIRRFEEGAEQAYTRGLIHAAALPQRGVSHNCRCRQGIFARTP